MSTKVNSGLLPEPAKYKPFCGGRYDAKPNLFRLGKDFGNGASDQRVLQIDNQFDEYRQRKLATRKTNYQDYIGEIMSIEDERAVNTALSDIARREYPEYFEKLTKENEWLLRCRLSGETLCFSNENTYTGATSIDAAVGTTYRSGLDALACQFQEDICVLKIDDTVDRLVAAHLCFPNRWSAPQKIGRSFMEIHQPVAGFEEANPNAFSLIRAMLGNTAYVRFAWGLSNDIVLDHHPEKFAGFHFKDEEDPLFVRVERQVLVGIAQNNLLLFFIRTYYEDCREKFFLKEFSSQLANSLLTMSQELLLYKDLSESRNKIVEWLKKPH